VIDYARIHRESANAHIEPFNLPGGIYNNGRRILFQATGKILMPHDRILESFQTQNHTNRSFVGHDSVLISERTRSTKNFKGSRHSRAATQMQIIKGQNRTIENAGNMPAGMITKLLGPLNARGSTAAFGTRNSTDNGFFRSKDPNLT
jgi:hypothetical protein